MKTPLTILTLLLFAAGCSSVHRFDGAQARVILVPQGIQDPTGLEEVGQRISKGEPVVFKVVEGERMPLRLVMDLPMGTLEKAEYTFAFTHDTYFLLSRKGLELSPDGQRWANITNPRALAKLFGFAHGQFSFSFNSATNESPFMKVEIKVSRTPAASNPEAPRPHPSAAGSGD